MSVKDALEKLLGKKLVPSEMHEYKKVHPIHISRELPNEDGSFGYKIVNGKTVPIQKYLPLIGYVCANCNFPVEYPSEYGGDLYCSQLCAYEDGHKVGVGEHILEAQRMERKSRVSKGDKT